MVKVAISPTSEPQYEAAVIAGGGVLATLENGATGLVWTDSQGVAALTDHLEAHPQVNWVQLPFAGVDNFKVLFEQLVDQGRSITITSAKGSYREPVAEHALMLALALARAIPERLAAKTWGRKFAATLFDANVLIVGGGGIANELIRLIKPFRPSISVVRREVQPMPDNVRVAGLDQFDELLPKADFVFLACALTEETRGLMNSARFALMQDSAYLVNIARGPVVVTGDLEAALRGGQLAGAGIDVTDPEPLPDSHTLWSAPNLIITPHSADTPEMCVRLLSTRIAANVANLISARPLEGLVNLEIGY
jgi:phosphoglycerate dehydrogenase-like enzyme